MDASLEELKNALESAIEGMTSEQWSRHPAGKWCAAEILEHLYLTYTGTIKGFEKVIAAGKPLATRVSIRQHVRRFVVVGLGHVPEGRTAPATARPKGLGVEIVKSEIGEKIVAMDRLIAECEARFGGVKMLDHMVLGPLTAGQWRKFHLVHGQHHLRQILRLREPNR